MADGKIREGGTLNDISDINTPLGNVTEVWVRTNGELKKVWGTGEAQFEVVITDAYETTV